MIENESGVINMGKNGYEAILKKYNGNANKRTLSIAFENNLKAIETNKNTKL